MEQVSGIQETIKRVSASVRGIAGSDAADVVQEAIARAIKNGVDPGSEAWLRTVARRVAIDRKRRSREYASGGAEDLDRYGKATDDDPEQAVIRAERSAELHKALAMLPARYRKALLAYAEEDSPADVAKRLGLSASATWTLLSRARSRLRIQLEQIGFVPVTVFGNGRWRAIIAGAAAAGVTAAAVVHPTLSPVRKPDPSSAPKVVQMAAPTTVKPSPVTTGLVPKVAIPQAKVAVPDLPDAAAVKPPSLACIGTPQLGLIDPLALVVLPAHPDPGVADHVVGLLPHRVQTARATHLCGS